MASTETDIRTDSPQFVNELQTYLRELSFDNAQLPLIAVDGVFGSETTGAVRAFQQLYGLPVTGDVDYATWVAIVAAYDTLQLKNRKPVAVEIFPSPDTVLKPGDRGNTVLILEVMLDALARRFRNIPRVSVNGQYDQQTEDAVKEVQRLHQLPQTGTVDAATWNALTATYNRHLSRRSALWV